MKAINYNISGVKCDAKGCDYVDDTARLEDYEKYLNAPCPKCGAPLITEADLLHVQKMVKLADVINAAVGPVPDGSPVMFAKVEMDGTGIPKKVTLSEERPQD